VKRLFFYLFIAALISLQMLWGEENTPGSKSIDIVLFSSALTGNTQAAAIKEKELTVKYYVTTEEVDLTPIVRELAGDESLILSEQSESKGGGKAVFKDFLWRQDYFTIQFHTAEDKPDSTILKITISDESNKTRFSENFAVTDGKTCYIFFKYPGKLLTFAARFAGNEFHYHSQYIFNGVTIYSDDDTPINTLEKEESVFNKARAVIPVPVKRLILSAERIVFTRDQKQLTGINVTLSDSKGQKLGSGNSISIPMDNPENFKIR